MSQLRPFTDPMARCHDGFDPPEAVVPCAGQPHDRRGAEPGEGERDFPRCRERGLDELIVAADPDPDPAFTGEPVIGSGGITPPPEVCREASAASAAP